MEEVKAPSQEVPLISVKVANKGAENTKAQNEPFGQSGTRCTLFDPVTEEPIGISEYQQTAGSSYRFVRQFKCQISGQREGGRYNMSVSVAVWPLLPAVWTTTVTDQHEGNQVALLGHSYVSEEQNMGEALVLDRQLQSDHQGESYMLLYRPIIRRIAPSEGGPIGGILLTIDGDGFSVGTCPYWRF